MNSFLTFVLGECQDSGPNSFDYFALIVSSLISVFSIWGGYKIANVIYRKEQNDRILEELMIQKTEVDLFKNSISQLKIAIDRQILSLNKYIQEKNFTIAFDQGIDTSIFNYVQIKYLYLDIGFANVEEINKVNELIALISSLKNFNTNLRNEVRAYMDKYAFHEQKRYQYRKLLYTTFYELYNERSVDVEVNKERKKFTFSTNDIFIKEYDELINKITSDKEVIFDGSLKSIDLLIERFILQLIAISSKFVPEDIHAIQILEMANVVNTAHNDINNINTLHFESVGSYNKLLKKVSDRIEKYFSLGSPEA